MNHLENYYANYDEEGRLLSKHGQVEYRTTMKYIHEMLEKTDTTSVENNEITKMTETPEVKSRTKKILEVGAGTGRYSIALAREGHEVDALEYTAHNLEIMDGKVYVQRSRAIVDMIV